MAGRMNSKKGKGLVGLPPMIAQVPTNQAQLERQQRLAGITRAHEVHKIISSTPKEKYLMQDITQHASLEEPVRRFQDLQAGEHKIDVMMVDKRTAMRDAGHRYDRRRRVMRVWISALVAPKQNEDNNRVDDAFGFTQDSPSNTYKVRIEGKLLPEPHQDNQDDELDSTSNMDLDKPDDDSKRKPALKFSQYFKQITVDFKKSDLSSDDVQLPPSIEWKRPEPQPNAARPATANLEANFDALEFERKLEEPIQKLEITLQRDEPVGRVQAKLKEPLARLLDREYEDKGGVIMGLYNYVRAHGLEEEGDPQKFRCDEPLKKIFNNETADFIHAPDVITKFLEPISPITLNFTVRSSGTKVSEPTIYDIPILVEEAVDTMTENLRRSSDYHHPTRKARLAQSLQYDADIALIIHKINEHKGNVDFLSNMAKDPAATIHNWLKSQKADREIAMAELHEYNHGRPSDQWNSPAALESVNQVIARKPTM